MLTKSDIKQIRTVVQEEVHKETDPIRKDTENLKAGQARTDKTLKSQNNKISKIQKTLDEATLQQTLLRVTPKVLPCGSSTSPTFYQKSFPNNYLQQRVLHLYIQRGQNLYRRNLQRPSH